MYSWRNINIGNAFKTSYEYKRNLESHMMKNTEWGAVTYLSHSEYGSNTRVRVNNNSAYITGYAAIEEPTKGYTTNSIEGNRYESTQLKQDGTYTINYYNPSSVVASTTGNYTGIYDLSSGAWEYVMGFTTTTSSLVQGSSGITSIYNDFFTNENWNLYYDLYRVTAQINNHKRILGDAIGEIGPFYNEKDLDNQTRIKSSWYKGYANANTNTNLLNTSSIWYARGGSINYGENGNSFAFSYFNGAASKGLSYRIILNP